MEAATFRFRDPLNQERRFIPLRLDEAPIKGSLAQFLYINWLTAEREPEYAKLLEACRLPRTELSPEQLAGRDQILEKIFSLGHTDSIRSVAFSPDGGRALSGSDDHTVRLWDLESGRSLRVLEGHSDKVNSVAFSTDGRRALSGSSDHTVRLWDVESGRSLRVLEGHSDSVLGVAFSPDGRRALSGSSDKTVRLWDVESGRSLLVLKGHSDRVLSVAFSPDGGRALSGSHDKTVRLWDVENGRSLRVLEGHSFWVCSAGFSPNGRRALSSSDDNTVRLWDVESGRSLRVLKGHSRGVNSVAFSPDGRRALSGSEDKTMRLWDVESGRSLRVLEGHSARVFSVAFSTDDHRALSGSDDNIVRLWEVESGRSLRVLEGHSDSVLSVAFSSDGRRALSSSDDNTVRLWEVESGRSLRVLKGHSASVWSVVFSHDGRRALSGSADKTVRLWDVESGHSLRVLEGHYSGINSVAFSPYGRRVLSGSSDKTVRLWDVESGLRSLHVLEGHSDSVLSVAFSPDGRRALSGSSDKTVRLWDVESGHSLRVLEGHSDSVLGVAFSPDGRRALSGSSDKTVRLWDVESGRSLLVLEGHSDRVLSVAFSLDGHRALSAAGNGMLRVWTLTDSALRMHQSEEKETAQTAPSDAEAQIEYTNAKVLLVGDTGVGKTGLTERLAHDTFTPCYSTSGTWSTQWQMKNLPPVKGWEREVWLWDFGGQADQRLIHQLYLDKAALVLLVFNADRDVVLPGLRDWQQALSRSVPHDTRTYLIAGRIDVGFRFDREKVRAFAQQYGYRYFETSAFDGRNCAELRQAIQTDIPWTQLERRTSPVIFKRLKDEILKLRDEGHVLFTFKELRETLRQRLVSEAKFADKDLETVAGLLDGPGVVKELSFGTYILLRPEWINAYAQAVIRTLRAEERNLGCLPVQSIAEGKLIFQMQQTDGEIVEAKRLEPREERIVLQAMEQMLLERRLCLRQEGNLVFPSYCGIEKPIGPVPPKYFISYLFGGFLDDIYATLVVKLAYCGAFTLKELWRDAADFETLADHRTMGIKLLRNDDGRGTLLVHFSKSVPPQEQVIFVNYIHEHLIEKASEPQRLRFYVCPNCDTPVKDSEEAMRRVEERGAEASIVCVRCEKRVPLWDSQEKRFASDAVKKQVALLQSQERITLDARRKGKLLVLEVAARITSADQKCFEIPGVEDEGLDMEVEFTDADGRGTGKRLYLQLKAGNSHLQRRKSDGAEIFTIKKQNWVKYWLKQPHPVLLVIGTFPEETDELRGDDKMRFADIRWMEISEPLREASKDGTQPVNQIVFKGETLNTMSVRRWRDKALGQGLL